MEGRMRKYGTGSPERSRVWAERPPKHHRHHQPQLRQQQQQQVRKVPVVYYLCRNRHLEHPHFIQVPTSSPEGLYLRDVINRLNVLRGKGMAAMYSWSCKRSYKNGFVWHDLSEDDLILAAHGNEYVLKGSELLDASPSDRSQHAASGTRSQASKRPQQETPSPSSSRSPEDASPSSPGVAIQVVKAPPPQPPPPLPAPAPEDELSPQDISPESKLSPPFGGAGGSSCPSPADYRVHKAIEAADASTQTEETEGASRRTRPSRGTRAMGVSTEEGSVPLELEDQRRHRTPPQSRGSSEISREEISPPPASSSSSGGKTETLESLIRAEVRKMNSFRILEEEELVAPTGPKLKATNVLMQLITCGSLSVKGRHSFGLVPTYKPRFSYVNYPSPVYSSSVVLGELDFPPKNSGIMGLRLEEKGCYNGSLVEAKKHKEMGEELAPAVQGSPLYQVERSCKSSDPTWDKEMVADSARLKCLPRTVKTTASKQSKNETVKSPLSDGRRNSSAGLPCHQCTSTDSSKECGKRTTDASSVKGSSMRLESCQKDKEKVTKIEERLTSGARVIIQSRAPCDDSEDSSSP